MINIGVDPIIKGKIISPEEALALLDKGQTIELDTEGFSKKHFAINLMFEAAIFSFASLLLLSGIKRDKELEEAYRKAVGDKFNYLYVPVGGKAFIKIPVPMQGKFFLYATEKFMGFDPELSELVKSIRMDLPIIGGTYFNALTTLYIGVRTNVHPYFGTPIVKNLNNPTPSPKGSIYSLVEKGLKVIGVDKRYANYDLLKFSESSIFGGLLGSFQAGGYMGVFTKNQAGIPQIISRFVSGSGGLYNQVYFDYRGWKIKYKDKIAKTPILKIYANYIDKLANAYYKLGDNDLRREYISGIINRYLLLFRKKLLE